MAGHLPQVVRKLRGQEESPGTGTPASRCCDARHQGLGWDPGCLAGLQQKLEALTSGQSSVQSDVWPEQEWREGGARGSKELLLVPPPGS